MKKEEVKIVSKDDFRKMTNRCGQGLAVACPNKCGAMCHHYDKTIKRASFICDVCKTEIKGDVIPAQLTGIRE